MSWFQRLRSSNMPLLVIVLPASPVQMHLCSNGRASNIKKKKNTHTHTLAHAEPQPQRLRLRLLQEQEVSFCLYLACIRQHTVSLKKLLQATLLSCRNTTTVNVSFSQGRPLKNTLATIPSVEQGRACSVSANARPITL